MAWAHRISWTEFCPLNARLSKIDDRRPQNGSPVRFSTNSSAGRVFWRFRVLDPHSVLFGNSSHLGERPRQRHGSISTEDTSVLLKVNVTLGPSCTLSTNGGRKQTILTPALCLTLGYKIPADPLVSNRTPRAWEEL